MLKPDQVWILCLPCALEIHTSLGQPSAANHEPAAQLWPCAPSVVSVPPRRRRGCTLFGASVCSVGFRCWWYQLLPSALDHGVTGTSPLPRPLGSSSGCAQGNLSPGTMGMLGCLLDPSNASWMGLEEHRVLTGSETWVLLVLTSKFLPRWPYWTSAQVSSPGFVTARFCVATQSGSSGCHKTIKSPVFLSPTTTSLF